MEDQMVIVGYTGGGCWMKNTKRFPNGLIVMSLQEASLEVAKHFKCSVDSAQESLLRNKYASSQNRHWHLKGGTVQGEMSDSW